MAAAAPRWRNQVVASVAERILLLVQLQRGAPGDLTGPTLDQRVRQIEIAILADPGRRWTVATLAGISHLSPSRFAHLFTQQVGMPPRRYIERARMERACELLLSTNTSVQEIARAVGYENPLHFSARFKSLTTKAPTEFRRHPRA